MVGKPKSDQIQEAVELIEKLKTKLGCSADKELASKLGLVAVTE